MNAELQNRLDVLFREPIATPMELQETFTLAQELIWTYPVRTGETVIVDMQIDPDPDRVLDASMWGLHIICNANDCIGWSDNGIKLAGAPGSVECVEYLYQRYMETCSKLFEQDYLESHPQLTEVPWEEVNADLHLYCSKVDYALGNIFNEIVYNRKKIRAEELYQECIVGFDVSMFNVN